MNRPQPLAAPPDEDVDAVQALSRATDSALMLDGGWTVA